jgi:hypothetical protein
MYPDPAIAADPPTTNVHIFPILAHDNPRTVRDSCNALQLERVAVFSKCR